MAKERTDKSKYKSLYSQAYVTAAQYIAELVCENVARKKETQLPFKFWNTPEWKSLFMRQLRLAQGLLKIYSEAALIKALKSKDGKRVLSLAAAWLLDSIVDKLEEIEKKIGQPIEVNKVDGVRPTTKKKNSLWNLDGDE